MVHYMLQKGGFLRGNDSCSSQSTKEGNESTLLVATLQSSFVPQTDHVTVANSQLWSIFSGAIFLYNC